MISTLLDMLIRNDSNKLRYKVNLYLNLNLYMKIYIQIIEWLENNAEGLFNIFEGEKFNIDKIIVSFELETDAIIFSIKFGEYIR